MGRRRNEIPPVSGLFSELRTRQQKFIWFESLDPKSIDWSTQAAMIAHWQLLLRAARPIGRWILETRSIPKGKAKAVELAVRAVDVQRTRDVRAWWSKNERHIRTLLEAEAWPERTTDQDDELIHVGPFAVHNTVHLKGDALKRTLAVVEAADDAIRGSDPILSVVLYGPVYIVGRLRVPRVLAWYYEKDDTVYLRPMPKSAGDETHNLIHELGHRYWNKFASPADKKAWIAHDGQSRNRRVDVPTPKIGDRIAVHGIQEHVPIVDIRYFASLNAPQAILESGGRVPIPSIIRVREQAIRRQFFPTGYAMTNAEEHFCEALAMHVLGTLPPEHDEFFERWLATSTKRVTNSLRRRLLNSF